MIEDDMREEVSLPYEEYSELTRARDILECLEAAGVDSWEGYDSAMDSYWNPDN